MFLSLRFDGVKVVETVVSMVMPVLKLRCQTLCGWSQIYSVSVDCWMTFSFSSILGYFGDLVSFFPNLFDSTDS